MMIDRRVFRWLLLYKFAVFTFVLFAARLLPGFLIEHNFYTNFHWPQASVPDFSTYFQTWDAQHFIALSQVGYQHLPGSVVYPPLWPFLISLGSFFTFGHSLIAGLLLSNLLSLAGLLLFHRLVGEEYGTPKADAALCLLLAFPGSLFFNFAYTESLFFFLVTGFFYALKRSRLGWAATAALFMVLTRLVGVLIILPLAVHLGSNRSSVKKWAALAGPLSGVALYLLVMHLAVGDVLAAFRFYYDRVMSHASLLKVFDLPGFIACFRIPLQAHGVMDSAIDRLFFFCFIACLPPLWRMNKVYFFYALVMGWVSAAGQSFMSYTRYLAVIFPLFIVPASALLKEGRVTAFRLLVIVLACLQAVFIFRHINNIWVA